MIWKWVHYTHLLIMVSWMFMLGVIIWRTAVDCRGIRGSLAGRNAYFNDYTVNGVFGMDNNVMTIQP
jgi:hypothetical protein